MRMTGVAYFQTQNVADDPPKTDDDEVEAGSDPDGRWGRGSRIQRNAECSLLGCNLKLGLAAI